MFFFLLFPFYAKVQYPWSPYEYFDNSEFRLLTNLSKINIQLQPRQYFCKFPIVIDPFIQALIIIPYSFQLVNQIQFIYFKMIVQHLIIRGVYFPHFFCYR